MKHLTAFLAVAVLVAFPACRESGFSHRYEFGKLRIPAGFQSVFRIRPAGVPRWELLDPGSGPRQPLRYRFSSGSRRDDGADHDTSLTMTGMQNMRMKFPTQRMTMTVHVDEIKPTGEILMSSELTKVEVLNTPGVPPQVLSAVRQQTRQLEGMTTTGRPKLTAASCSAQRSTSPAA